MQFQTPLIPAVLIRRYKRFLADIRLPDGSEHTAHCANPGAMTGLAEPGTKIWVQDVAAPGRKLGYSWKLAELPEGHWAVVDTALPNRVVEEALLAGRVPELAGYHGLRSEVRYGENSRIDFLLQSEGRPDTYVEVKAVTLSRRQATGEFPDSVTKRGAKHLRELSAMVAAGHRAAVLFAVHRTDCTGLAIASDIDPDYGAAFVEARRLGVEVLCYGTRISPQGVELTRAFPILHE